MSQQLINRSSDLKRLRDEGYDVEVRANHLVIKNVPYVNSSKEIKFGLLVSELTLAGDITTAPNTHVAMFSGEHPCHKDGSELIQIKHASNRQQLGDGLVVDHSFSSKPTSGRYADFYEKMTTYVAIVSAPAQSIDPSVTARVFPAIPSDADEDSVFHFIDTASSRAGINAIGEKLSLEKVGIVGLGGTGSYVLDLVAKTLIREIHLFDGDIFSQHNAFRSPGAPSLDDLQKRLPKVEHFREKYSQMRKQIVSHNGYITSENVEQLRDMNFVFLCLDNGASRRLLVEKLEEFGIPFIDVGMGIQQVDGALGGILRITISTEAQRDCARLRIPLSEDDGNNEYSQNIQLADLNALNASLAVIKWKKLFGFYRDLENEFHCTYTIDGNVMTNEINNGT
ncbi:MAG TPA: ThiF family adenylyltransferase [Candidatus Hydrogenedentes bacterium]|nr:ThiF family adenylyltransferase [Candidatus Hydrogenedentota bacterium]